jgi:excisionase family DNA binding protein
MANVATKKRKNYIYHCAPYAQLQGERGHKLMNKTAKEASAYLKVVPRTLYRHMRKHQIPALRLGREWRFIKSELDKWLMRRLQESLEESK